MVGHCNATATCKDCGRCLRQGKAVCPQRPADSERRYFSVLCALSGHVEKEMAQNGQVWATVRRFEDAYVVRDHKFFTTCWNDTGEVAGMRYVIHDPESFSAVGLEWSTGTPKVQQTLYACSGVTACSHDCDYTAWMLHRALGLSQGALSSLSLSLPAYAGTHG